MRASERSSDASRWTIRRARPSVPRSVGGGGVAASARSIDEITAIDAGRGLVRPIITPRFTPACTDDLLRGLGELAAATGVPVQTHCSESDWEHGHALERFGTTDTSALDAFGLLRPGTVLAHANHVTDDDAMLIGHRGAGIAHCPLSNAYFANAVLPVRHLVDRGRAGGPRDGPRGGRLPEPAAPGPRCRHGLAAAPGRR